MRGLAESAEIVTHHVAFPPISFLMPFSDCLLDFSIMVLTEEELRSLVEANHRSPHQLLGMHPLGNGSGVVVRAFAPHAAKVEAHPVHEKDQPVIKLERIPNT